MSVELTNVEVEKSEDGLVTLQISVSPDSVRQTRTEVIRDYTRRVRISGFRPGKAPANLVRRHVGDEAIAQQVSDKIVPEAYQQALEQTELQPLERAQVDQLTFDAFDGESPLQFTARAVMRPTIELPELKGIHVVRQPIEVGDDDVAEALERLRQEHATPLNVEGRGAQPGDVLSAELQVFVNDEARTEEPEMLSSFVLGDSGFTPSIDEHLVDAQLDEERRFPVTYPSDYHDAELAGQAAEFVVKVTAIRERVLPELDDTFAASLGLENLDTLQQRIRQMLRDERRRESRESLRRDVTQTAVDSTAFDLPSNMLDRRSHNRFHMLEHDLQQRGATVEQYLETTGQSREELEEELRHATEDEMRRELVLEVLAEREDLEVSNQEIEFQYRMMAQALQQPVEQIVQNFDVHAVRASILQRKAVDWLLEHAEIEGEEPPEETFAVDELAEAEVPEDGDQTPVTTPAITAAETDETIATTGDIADEAAPASAPSVGTAESTELESTESKIEG